MRSPRPVAVTGLGCICAAGTNLAACLDTLYRGERAPQPPARFHSDHPVRYPVFAAAAELPGGERLGRTARLAIVAAREAVADAGWSPAALAGRRVGVIVGTTVGSAMNNEDFYADYLRGGEPPLAQIERFLGSNPATAVARDLGLTGPCQTVVNACSSGTDAVGIGAAWIRAGECDLVLAGGADELCRITYNGFISLMITDDAPVRPFDRRRKGLNLGEGAGFLLLEADGLRADRPPRAFVAGYGSACDAHHLTAPHPEGAGLKRALAEALDQCGAAAADLAFVNAHGTGTPDNDRIESRTLAVTLPGVPFLSTKGYTGHTLGASGAIEAAFTVAALERGEVPANAGFGEADPQCPATPVTANTPVRGEFALSQSLAFGGNNAVVVFRKGGAR
ncbi:MAG: beta-ketoacyl-[acyl-carrier-protein] synthase family protein [Desulfuromonadales bacterium]|jgi:3-oxoacyl-[acyl-carrier-protein] synthase-1/3-oxoacyl-[acyl-carrier-protein] synthase II